MADLVSDSIRDSGSLPPVAPAPGPALIPTEVELGAAYHVQPETTPIRLEGSHLREPHF
jgi:hypothetical protein